MQLQQRSGFTIVELLIVIVVIGILAAITIVSYDGITTRGYETAVMNDLKVMGDGAAIVSAKGMGTIPAATQAGLEKIVKISRPEAYLDTSTGSLAYCRNNEQFAFIARAATSSTLYEYVSDGGGVKQTSPYSSAINTLCGSVGISSSSAGYGSIWLFSGANSPKWLAWISLPTS